jgi:hypothetical protein
MGLLDDAIRDHLELKRRHGADPSEVARLEHEALGPARREPVAPASAPAHEDHDDDVLYEDEAELVYERPAAGADDLEPSAADEYVEELAEDEEPIYDEDLYEDEEEDLPAPSMPAGEPEAPIAPTGDGREGLVDQPTRQYSVDELGEIEEDDEPRHSGAVRMPRDEDEPADDKPRRDDVLEETPEFLQETPEHDRLWFEQKPPRDFDF